ncbi:glycoside hydrolase family 53 protein [Colletotrichum truncatum]|uniref:Glycoside hydrolase family 53 protein n=1 Tax=Colletotrichum truncatum TaxID=5467 RepID=A0ACC3Z2B9_COLTU|nr:glycoside hydrolase family 53 protein [Colletotrichum truncatum]KAF6786509.1 glycoside hydrolase family 53 protein [Colletotrichum truncatum]
MRTLKIIKMLFSIAPVALTFLTLIFPATATPQLPPRRPKFYYGHDISSVKWLEDSGASFKDSARHNKTRPLEDILGDGGMNAARLRLWVDPPSGDHNLEYNLELASRLYKKGYAIYLDFHFSDNWADPGKQITPAAWPTTFDALSKTLRNYVKDTLIAFHKAGIDLAIVSLGNEVTHGMLWPLGYATIDIHPKSSRIANFTDFARLYTSARGGVDDAVRRGVSKPDTMLHLSFGWNSTLQEIFYETLIETGIVKPADWDVFGISFYPWNGLRATYDNLRKTIGVFTSPPYVKPVHVVETDYPVSCPALNISNADRLTLSPQGQTDWVREVVDILKETPKNLGRGIWYWEPASIDNPPLGSACEDVLLFDRQITSDSKLVGYSRESVNMYKPKKRHE